MSRTGRIIPPDPKNRLFGRRAFWYVQERDAKGNQVGTVACGTRSQAEQWVAYISGLEPGGGYLHDVASDATDSDT